jgi:hypothetical protein
MFFYLKHKNITTILNEQFMSLYESTNHTLLQLVKEKEGVLVSLFHGMSIIIHISILNHLTTSTRNDLIA